MSVKAIQIRAPGGPDQLEYAEAPLPEPREGQVRVRVHAAGISPHELSWNSPNYDGNGPAIPGHEFSGVVHALGPGALGVSVGEDVYGLCEFGRGGCDAEYVVVPAANVAPKPFALTHVYAAAVPLSGLTAWQALFNHADLQPGQHIL